VAEVAIQDLQLSTVERPDGLEFLQVPEAEREFLVLSSMIFFATSRSRIGFSLDRPRSG